MSVTRVVTVVLPSVPVMASDGTVVPLLGEVELAADRHAVPAGELERDVRVADAR